MFPSDAHPLSVYEDIDINKIELTNQVRRDYGHTIPELVDSIRKVGLLQPILVRVNKEGHFEIVCDCRRYTACKALGFKKMACVIIEAGDKEAFEISLIENIQRSSLEPLEEARAFRKYVLDTGWGGISELASKVGRSHSYIVKHIMLLDLPRDVLTLITSQELNASTAQELFPIKNYSKQSDVAKMIVNGKWSSKDTRFVVNTLKDQSELGTVNMKYEFPNRYDEIRRIERSLAKSILILRIAMSRIGQIIDEYEDSWLVYETLMVEKNALHSQIDLALKMKKRLVKNMSGSNSLRLPN
ncbi:MAG: ParB/RepB/Spo0J family partition protein [Nitrososphaeraceae archaeon]|jgi:ParB family chromosome partitioning protein